MRRSIFIGLGLCAALMGSARVSASAEAGRIPRLKDAMAEGLTQQEYYALDVCSHSRFDWDKDDKWYYQPEFKIDDTGRLVVKCEHHIAGYNDQWGEWNEPYTSSGTLDFSAALFQQAGFQAVVHPNGDRSLIDLSAAKDAGLIRRGDQAYFELMTTDAEFRKMMEASVVSYSDFKRALKEALSVWTALEHKRIMSEESSRRNEEAAKALESIRKQLESR